ncbi:MAG: diguanylate cyclase, partial [Lachnospiraceae bacterium]|nr:diguanylate cyclase [Lachnospiraceae bacterium]
GHEAGDDMLRRVALYISKIWGEENSYRIGGDEFVIFVFDQEMENIHKDVDGFNKALQTYGYSASLGYAREEEKVDDIHSLIRDAETEMYRAKKDHYKGKNDRRRH